MVNLADKVVTAGVEGTVHMHNRLVLCAAFYIFLLFTEGFLY